MEGEYTTTRRDFIEGQTALNAQMLRGMLDRAKTFTFYVGEIAGGVHSTNSKHYQGRAFDIGVVNGRRVAKSNASSFALMKLAKEHGASLVLGPGDKDHDTHIHIEW